ncbi:MAG: alpha/beta hydrolase [Bacilli bacterium]|nr:alpha/beta hydrolase [Bacilli bacterium]
MTSPLTIEKKSFTLDLGQDLYIRGETRTLNDGILKPVLLINHGFKAFKDWGFFPYIAEWFAQQGLFTVLFNFSKNGVHLSDFDELDKFADNTYSQEQRDLEALFNSIKTGILPLAANADRNQIIVLGHSRGGGNSLIFAAEHPDIRAVISWNGIAYANLFDEAFEAEARKNGIAFIRNTRTKQQMPISQGFFDDLQNNSKRFDILAQFAALTIPVLIVQSDQDSDQHLFAASQFREVAPHQTHLTIAGGNHVFGAVHPFQGTTPQLEEALKCTYLFLHPIIKKINKKEKHFTK